MDYSALPEPVLIREEKSQVIDYEIVKTLGRTKLRKTGESIETLTQSFAVEANGESPESSFGKLVSRDQTTYGGTPYKIVTKRYEK